MSGGHFVGVYVSKRRGPRIAPNRGMFRRATLALSLIALLVGGCAVGIDSDEDGVETGYESLESIPGRDPFGVRMIHPTARRGRTWFARWDSHPRTIYSGQVDPRDPTFHNRGRGNSFRVLGDGRALSSGGIQRHYIWDRSGSREWRDVELTFYAMRVREEADAPSRAGFTVTVRSGDGHTSDRSRTCAGHGYGATFRYWGGAKLGKEIRHPATADVGGPEGRHIWGGDELPKDRWIGFKFVVRNVSGGGVRLELYRDLTDGRNGGDWERIMTYVDRGGWGLGGSGTICGRPWDWVIREAHPVVLIRNDESTLYYKWASVREIDSSDGHAYRDIEHSTFVSAIEALDDEGIAFACNPPFDDWYCPGAPLRREEMAAFLTRALDLPPGPDVFRDDERSPFEAEIQALARARITHGCNPPDNDRFCPDSAVTRGQMAAFLRRAYDLPSGPDAFRDDDGSTFEDAINAIARAGITHGCNPPANDHFCPDAPVTRGQIAALIARARRR